MQRVSRLSLWARVWYIYAVRSLGITRMAASASLKDQYYLLPPAQEPAIGGPTAHAMHPVWSSSPCMHAHRVELISMHACAPCGGPLLACLYDAGAHAAWLLATRFMSLATSAGYWTDGGYWRP